VTAPAVPPAGVATRQAAVAASPRPRRSGPATGLVWSAPAELALSRLGTLELRQTDPGLPPPPRPGDRLGPLPVRAVESLGDGRGWRITVQPLAPGLVVVPPLDLGDGRPTPELRLRVPRTVATGAPWMGVGGGALDRLPPLPCPWAWSLPLLLPLALLVCFLAVRLRRAAPGRARRTARRGFQRHWPPPSNDRAALDAAHTAGRRLLAAQFGPQALGWSPDDCRARGLEPWAAWIQSLDTARFGGPGPDPDWTPFQTLLAALEPGPGSGKARP